MGTRQCQLGLTNVCRMQRPLKAGAAISAPLGGGKVSYCMMIVNGVHWAQAQSFRLPLLKGPSCKLCTCGRPGAAKQWPTLCLKMKETYFSSTLSFHTMGHELPGPHQHWC